MDSRVLPSIAEIGKAEVTKPVRGIHHENRLVFTPFSGAPEAILSKPLQDHSFPIRHPSVSFVQICPVFDEIYPKMSPRLITISA